MPQFNVKWDKPMAIALVDVLGTLFYELELHNKYKGQFFTPQHVCDMMGAIALGDNKSAFDGKGYLSMCEPCCGFGALVLGFAKAMMDAELNYCTQLVVAATDIDLKCVYMCFLQLSLYGIPAVVIHGMGLRFDDMGLPDTHFELPAEDDLPDCSPADLRLTHEQPAAGRLVYNYRNESGWGLSDHGAAHCLLD